MTIICTHNSHLQPKFCAKHPDNTKASGGPPVLLRPHIAIGNPDSFLRQRLLIVPPLLLKGALPKKPSSEETNCDNGADIRGSRQADVKHDEHEPRGDVDRTSSKELAEWCEEHEPDGEAQDHVHAETEGRSLSRWRLRTSRPCLPKRWRSRRRRNSCPVLSIVSSEVVC